MSTKPAALILATQFAILFKMYKFTMYYGYYTKVEHAFDILLFVLQIQMHVKLSSTQANPLYDIMPYSNSHTVRHTHITYAHLPNFIWI